MREFRSDLLGLFEDILNNGTSLRVKVTGRSMLPFLKGNEILSIKKVPAFSLQRGDLVLFRNPQSAPIIHRIIRKVRKHDNIAFQTKGDALFMPDELISQNEVLGKVCNIEKPAFFPWAKSINMESFCWKKVNFSIAMLGLLRTELRNAALKFL